MKFLEELAARRRFGMKPGLETMRRICAALGNPERRLRAIHVAGTNGKGAVCAILDSCLRAEGFSVARYTSPHLVCLNERFFLNGSPVEDVVLESAAERVAAVAPQDTTFFEALTATAFLIFAEAGVDYSVLETGLGGRMDATNVCPPVLSIITRIGLDHCDWLGDTVELIAAEKGGIIKENTPVVLGDNIPSVRRVIAGIASQKAASLSYASEIENIGKIPSDYTLKGTFNRENAVTALTALRILGIENPKGLDSVVWPGRFHRVGGIIVDGAHNPPAATALANALDEFSPGTRFSLVAGFCGDKDIDATLRILRPFIGRGFAVRTNNPRSLSPEAVASAMEAAGIPATPCQSLHEALSLAGEPALVCGSLFLAGEALVELGAYPWRQHRFDPSELLKPTEGDTKCNP